MLIITCLFPAIAMCEEMPDCWQDPNVPCVIIGEQPFEEFTGIKNTLTPQLGYFFKVERVIPRHDEPDIDGTEFVDCFIQVQEWPTDMLPDHIQLTFDDEGIQYVMDIDYEFVPYTEIGVDTSDCSSPYMTPSAPWWKDDDQA